MAPDFTGTVQLVSNIAVIISALAIYYSSRSYRAAAESNKAQTFIALRNQFLETHEKLGFAVHSAQFAGSFQALPGDQQSAIFRYWSNSFNEWYIMHHVFGRDGRKMWLDFYREAQATSLAYPLVRQGLQVMFVSNFSFGRLCPAYKKEVMQMISHVLDGTIPTNISTQCRNELRQFESELQH